MSSLLYAGVLITIGGFLLYAGWKIGKVSVVYLWRGVRLLREDVTPLADLDTRIGSLVETTGEAAFGEGKETLTAPLSGRECVAWQVRRQDYSSRNTPEATTKVANRSYSTHAWARESTEFLLRDGSSEATIDPEGAEIQWDGYETIYETESGEGLPPEVRDRLERLASEAVDIDGRMDDPSVADLYNADPARKIRYQEAIIEPGTKIHIHGGQTETPRYREQVASITGGEFYTVTLGDESAAIESTVKKFGVISAFAVPTFLFGALLLLAGAANLLAAL